MKRSKRIEVLDQRPVNKDGFIDEWPEMGFVSMHSPYAVSYTHLIYILQRK